MEHWNAGIMESGDRFLHLHITPIQLITAILSFCILHFSFCIAQSPDILVNRPASADSEEIEQWVRPYRKAIDGNSYFVEEAFNQEPRKLQTILNVRHFRKPDNQVIVTLTQEWPLWGQTHQFSYEIPYVNQHPGAINGFGDVQLNYRFQLLNKDDGSAIAPRLSVILPIGDESKGLGREHVGYETNIPISKRLSDPLIAHFNLGANVAPNVAGHRSLYPGADIVEPVEQTLVSYNLGGSIIWLAAPNYNFMLEYVADVNGRIGEDGDVLLLTDHTVVPGVRFAFERNNLQVVPGLAIPVRR